MDVAVLGDPHQRERPSWHQQFFYGRRRSRSPSEERFAVQGNKLEKCNPSSSDNFRRTLPEQESMHVTGDVDTQGNSSGGRKIAYAFNGLKKFVRLVGEERRKRSFPAKSNKSVEGKTLGINGKDILERVSSFELLEDAQTERECRAAAIPDRYQTQVRSCEVYTQTNASPKVLCCGTDCCSTARVEAMGIGASSANKQHEFDYVVAEKVPDEPERDLDFTEAESDTSHYDSPDDCTSHPSTASLVSVSTPASPVQSSLPSAVFSRCQTAPAGGPGRPDVVESLSLSLTSQIEKACDHTHGNTSHRMPVPAQKLSEREKKKLIENLAKIKNDGTVEVNIDQGTEITPTLFDLDDLVQGHVHTQDNHSIELPSQLNIVMLVVGTRGDVQPFVAIGKRLQEKGHRVRLATHANFREFVTLNGLDFYPLGGDPKDLAGYMVKNKGFLPSRPAEISIQKKQLKAIVNSLLPACTEAEGESGSSFKADALIANPTAYGHVHVAEYLDVPLHIFFTMPWTPTNEFPHPLARVKQQAGYWISYVVVNSLMWWGMRGLINEFRVKKLKLSPITYFSTKQGSIAHLPTGYMWSPHLVPKPKDWGPWVDVVGYCFLSLASDFTPPNALDKWLKAGEKPIYFGFGSLPVEDPGSMTDIIVQALQETNQRGIIDKGWGGLGNLKEEVDSIFLLENCPHDWLFPQCAAVVHHGGAGTTAAGLKAGCPTTIVPFFGDQLFWGERVWEKGVGPPPIPIQQFSSENLVNAINCMLDPEVKQRALELARQIGEEDGVEAAVTTFHRHWVRRIPSSSAPGNQPSLLGTILAMMQRLTCLPCCI